MHTALVDFGTATFSHKAASQQLLCSFQADVQGETEIFEDAAVSAEIFCQQELWIRCHSTLSLNFLFAFDNALLRTCNLIELQQALANFLASESLWSTLGLDLSSSRVEESTIGADTTSFSIILSLNLSASTVSSKSNKRWRRMSGSTVNDVSTPAGLPSVRLDAVTIACSFRHCRQQLFEKSNAAIHGISKHSCMILTEASIKSTLGIGPRPPKGIQRETAFQHTLQSAFPSIFCRTYAHGISQRTLLVPSVTRALAAFQNRVRTSVDTSIHDLRDGHDPPTRRSAGDNTTSSPTSEPAIELQLWKSMLGTARLPAGTARQPNILRHGLSPTTGNTASLSGLYAADVKKSASEDKKNPITLEPISMEHSLFELNPDQAQELSSEILEYAETAQESDDRPYAAAYTARTSFEELAEDRMLVAYDDSEWTSYRQSDPASSQDTAITSEMDDYEEDLQAYEDYDKSIESSAWAESIGQCPQLTQMSGRWDPLFNPVLRSGPGPKCEDASLEALHISAFSSEYSFCDLSPAVTDLDDSIRYTTAIAAGTTTRRPVISTSCEPSETTPHDLLLFEGDNICSDLFGAEDTNMHIEGAEVEEWRSRVASPDLFQHDVLRPATEQVHLDSQESTQAPHGRPPSVGSFLKRASTISTSTSSGNGSPKRHRSILQRLSRRSSTRNQPGGSEMSELGFQVPDGREVEVKRRKTLDDYNRSDDREDAEMLFM